MKVIDLLNKIANGEELPETIKVRSSIYHKYFQSGYFYAIGWEEDTLLDNIQVTTDLIEEVEIIEEDKEIEKKEFDEIDEMTDYDIYSYPECGDDSKENFKNKINELIRNQKKIIKVVNELKKEGK